MKLILVTFETDLTQFLVDTDNYADAIQEAMNANRACASIDGIEEEVGDISNYTCEDVDFNMLSEMFRRTDCGGRCENAIVFWD